MIRTHWSLEAGLHINANKTQAMLIGSPHNLRKINLLSLPSITVNGVNIPFSSSVKNLGLHISSDLKWGTHVNSIVTYTTKTLNFLYSKCRSLPIKLKKNLVSQLLFPKFDYACVTFFDLPKKLANILDRQLNQAIRFIFNLSRRTSTNNYRLKLN